MYFIQLLRVLPSHHLHDITGVWGVGLATPMIQVDVVPLGNDQHSWVLTSDGTTLHNGEVISRLKVKPEEGSIVVSEVHVQVQCA